MITKEDLDELLDLVELARETLNKEEYLEKINWKVRVDVPVMKKKRTITATIDEKNEIKVEKTDAMNRLKEKIKSLEWSTKIRKP